MVAGGVIGTLLDCHTGAAVLKAVGERDGKTPYVDGPPWVTRSYEISLCRPTPLDRPIELRAGVIELHDDRAVAEGRMIVDGTVTATIRADWRRLPPRTSSGD